MTVIKETRYTQNGTPFNVYLPVHKASETAYREFVAETLREFLYREGCNVTNIPDEGLLRRTRYTFQTTNARDGITSAKPVESEQANPTSSEEEPCLSKPE